jgi:hypothetical protein
VRERPPAQSIRERALGDVILKPIAPFNGGEKARHERDLDHLKR